MQNTVDWASLKKQADDATKPAPPGDYVVEITKTKADTNASGNPMYRVEGKIVEGPSKNKSVFNNISLTLDKGFAMAIFFRHMAALGLGDEYFSSGPSHEKVCQDLIGRRAIWKLDIQNFRGQDRNSVEDITPMSGPLAQGGIGQGIVPSTAHVSHTASSMTVTPNGASQTPPTPQIPTPSAQTSTPSTPSTPSAPSMPPTPFDF